MTRALRLALGGHWAEATALYPLWLPVSAWFVVVILREVAAAQGIAHARCATRWLGATGMMLAVALVAVWLARFGGACGGPVPVD